MGEEQDEGGKGSRTETVKRKKENKHKTEDGGESRREREWGGWEGEDG
jgi:hypothetical protein